MTVRVVFFLMVLRQTYQTFRSCVLAIAILLTGAALHMPTMARAEPAQMEDQVVADLGKERIRLSDVDAYLSERLGVELFGFDTLALRILRRAALDQIIDARLLLLGYPLSDVGDIPEWEARRAYDADPERFRTPDEFKLRIITLPRGGASDIDTRAGAERILRDAREDPKSFSRLAREFSSAPNRERGGSLGTVTLNQLPEEIRMVALRLQAGDISEVFETADGLTILRVEERRGGAISAFESVREEIEAQIKAEKSRIQRREHVSELRRQFRPIVYLR